MLTKVCSKCGEEKSIDSYYKKKDGKYGVGSICKSCTKEYYQEYRQKNKERLRDYKRQYYEENKERLKNYNKKYNQENKERVHSQIRERRRNDPQFKLSRLIRERLKDLVRSGRGKKHCGYNEYIGCTPEELVRHIEAQFHKCPSTGREMSWDNHGEWHIDHIRPLASFDLTKEEDFMQANHYTNLQPLWAEENLSKGANWDEG